MSYGLRRRSGPPGIAGARIGQTTVLARQGEYRDALDRHESECRSSRSAEDRRQLHTQTFTRITDERILRTAMDHLDQDGPKAAGPNGIRLRDLNRSQRWDLARTLRDLLRSGTYSRGRTRNVEIPKGNGKPGTRTLKIPNAEDQVVQRAAVSILQPILDPRFDILSFGFRPDRNREHALATAQYLAHVGHQTLLLEDIRNAFDNVPHRPLLETLGHYGTQPQTVELIRRCIAGSGDRGLSQGGCLSPLLLNVYLDHFLDRHWRRQMPHTPLIRYADDICVTCRSQEEGVQAYATLQRLIRPTGLSLKGSSETAIHDLRVTGTSANWLGYQLTVRNGELIPDLAEEWLASLGDHLRLAHHEPYSSASAYSLMMEWARQLGPCPPQDMSVIHQRITQTALRHGYEEIPPMVELRAARDQAVGRFTGIRERMWQQLFTGSDDSSAYRDRLVATSGHTSGAPHCASTAQQESSAC